MLLLSLFWVRLVSLGFLFLVFSMGGCKVPLDRLQDRGLAPRPVSREFVAKLSHSIDAAVQSKLVTKTPGMTH